jgi:hypothetical protein
VPAATFCPSPNAGICPKSNNNALSRNEGMLKRAIETLKILKKLRENGKNPLDLVVQLAIH